MLFILYIKHVAFFIRMRLHHKWVAKFWGDMFNKILNRFFLVTSKKNTVSTSLKEREKFIYIRSVWPCCTYF